MSITARDLYFVLRCRDEATNTLNHVSRDILEVGAAAQAASKKAEAAGLRQQAANVRAAAASEMATHRQEAAALREQAAVKAAAAAQEAAATKTQVAELKRQAAALKSSGATQQEINMINREVRTVQSAADLKAKASQKEIDDLRARARESDKAAATIARATKDEIDPLNAKAKALEAEARGYESAYQKQQQYARGLRDISSLLTISGLVAVGAGAAGIGILYKLVQASSAYEQQVALTKTQVDGFSASLQQLGQLGKDVAANIAVPFNEVQPALYNIFSSTNANLAQATVLLNAFAKAAVAGQVSIDDASKGTMTILNAFKIPFDQVNQVLDVQFQLVRKGVGTYAEFNSVMGRIVPSAVRAGATLQDTAGILAYLTRNGLSAAMAASSGARALDALSNPKAVASLEAYGIQVKDAKGNFMPLIDVVTQLSTKLSGLSETARSAKLQDLFKGAGGTIQAMRFFDLVTSPGQLKDFQDLLASMNNAAGQFGQAYSTMANTTAAKTQLLKNNWDVMKQTIGEDLKPIFTQFIGVLAQVVGWFNRLSPHTQDLIAKGILIASIFSIIVGTVLIVLGAIAGLAAALASLGLGLGEILGIVALVIVALVGLGVEFEQAYKHSGPFRQILQDTITVAKQLWDFLKGLAKGVKDNFDKDLRPALEKFANVLNTQVLPIVEELYKKYLQDALKEFKEVSNWLKTEGGKGFQWIAWLITNYLIPAFQYLSEQYKEHKTGINQVIDFLSKLATWVAKVAGSVYLGALIAVILIVVGALATLVIGLAAAINWISHIIGWIGDFIGAIKKIPGELEKFGNYTGQQMNKVGAYFAELPAKVSAYFGDAKNILYQAGKDIINGLINGMLSNLSKLGNFLGSVGSYITQHKGPPVKDAQLLRNNGQLIMKSLIKGMKDLTPQLNTELQGLTAQINTTVQAQQPFARSDNRGPTSNTTYNQEINVTTQEINPRVHAVQLGNMLVGRTT